MLSTQGRGVHYILSNSSYATRLSCECPTCCLRHFWATKGPFSLLVWLAVVLSSRAETRAGSRSNGSHYSIQFSALHTNCPAGTLFALKRKGIRTLGLSAPKSSC